MDASWSSETKLLRGGGVGGLVSLNWKRALHALEVPSRKAGTMFADMRAAYDTLPAATKERLAGLVGLHGRRSGPGGREILRRRQGREREGVQRIGAPSGNQPPADRPPDLVRKPDAHAWLRRDEPREGMAADRGAGRPFDAGAASITIPGTSGDLGRAGDDAPQRRRLPPRRAPHHAAHDRL